MKKSTLLHLRIPFSYYLLPVFFFAVATIEAEVGRQSFWMVFVILHFFVYPASNGYNSYFDKDEGSIGGLKNPPKVSKELYNVSILMDLAGLVLACFVNIQFALMVLVYGLVSKAYSHPKVRLKKYPYWGWYAAGFFQGYFTFIMCVIGIAGLSFHEVFTIVYQFPAVLCTLLLFGSYPMTQVYQHEEDYKRGDRTISIILGVLGTFYFTAGLFALATAGFVLYFYLFYDLFTSIVFLATLSPILIFFFIWYIKVRKDASNANFENTMRLNFISSTAFNLFFLGLWIL